ncbi:MAG: LPS-assembly protein LptD [Magnetovibrio sp.]|nr:LPS-assembly protein LptD [Magnetovibrio sp.]
MTCKRILLALLFAATLNLSGAVAFAQTANAPAETPPAAFSADSPPAAFSADSMTHDNELGIITARGHVEINQSGRTLIADLISYDQTRDLIRASGNITLLRTNGDVIFADTMEVTGDLKNGVIDNMRAVLADKSRIAAQRGKLVNDEVMTMDRVVYTRCNPCQAGSNHAPLWQIKSVKVVHDRKTKTVTYQDSWLEIAGIPVLYMPYLSHPDPTVKRKSGFLAPRAGGSSTLGFTVQTPYFYVLDDQSDVTLTPIITTDEIGAVAGQYRGRFTKGELQTEASLAYDSNQDILGHIKATASFDINNKWRWGANLNRTISDTYMRRYGFGNEDTLTSKVFLEGLQDNTFTSLSAMSFQGLRRADNSKTTPVILPVIDFKHQTDPDRFGAYKTIDVNVAMLTRDQGVSSKRISVKPGWNLSYTAPKGDIYKLSASLGVDFFHAANQPAPDSRGGTYNGAALRLTPQVSIDWKWPLARRSGSVTEVLEPMAQVIVSPFGGNSYKMANEDSQDFDFNDANLFSTNRFTGYDRVESGPRTNYGLKWSVTGDNGGTSSIMLGQSYRMKKDDTFKVGSGLENNFSDYVGKIQVSPSENFNLLYRTRLDKDTWAFRRNEIAVSGTSGWLNYGANHVFFDTQQGSEFAGRKELSYYVGAKLTNDWSGRFSGVRDLTQTGGQRSSNLSFTYDNECLTFETTIGRTFYQDREVQPNDSIMFRVVFKTLGEVTSDVSVN